MRDASRKDADSCSNAAPRIFETAAAGIRRGLIKLRSQCPSTQNFLCRATAPHPAWDEFTPLSCCSHLENSSDLGHFITWPPGVSSLRSYPNYELGTHDPSWSQPPLIGGSESSIKKPQQLVGYVSETEARGPPPRATSGAQATGARPTSGLTPQGVGPHARPLGARLTRSVIECAILTGPTLFGPLLTRWRLADRHGSRAARDFHGFCVF